MWRRSSVVTPFNIYSTDHPHSQRVCAALRAGTGFPVVKAAPLLAGGVAAYGFLRGLLPTLNQARREGRAWAYLDRGDFRATYGNNYAGFFPLTLSAFHTD